jgi:hypothetical protein
MGSPDEIINIASEVVARSQDGVAVVEGAHSQAAIDSGEQKFGRLIHDEAPSSVADRSALSCIRGEA